MHFLGLIFAVSLNLSLAADNHQLTLDECFLKAVRKSYSLANQDEALKQAEEHYTQAWQNFTPTLSLTGGESTVGYYNPGTTPTNIGSYKVALTQPLFRGFRSISILEQSGGLIKSQKEAREWAFYQLYMDTAQSFYNILSIQKQLEHYQTQIQLYDQRIQEVSAWVRIGRSRGSDLSSIKATRALAYSQMVQYRGLLTNSIEYFRFLTGISNDINLSPDTNLNTSPPELSSYIDSMKERADLKAAKSLSMSTEKLIDIARSDRLPWADLSLSAGNPQVWNSGTPLNWNIQLSVTFSIFADTFVNSKIREAESIRNQSDNAYRYLFDSIYRDVRTSYAAFLSDLEQIKSYRESLKYLEDNLHQLERDYRLGAVKITDVLTASGSYEDTLRALDTLTFQAGMEWVRLNIYSGQFSLPKEVK
jgi:outer membrane protein